MEKVLVALSGGVDSSTAAALLKQQGLEVAGAIMVFEGVLEEDINYAQAAAQVLDIPFYTFDFAQQYKNMIVDNFIQEYKTGRTPNPCILCNRHIKFDLFLRKALELNIDRIATGHYALVEKSNGRYLLKRGKDKNEQSYFLYRLEQNQLAKVILSLGSYTKEEIRKLAKNFRLPTATRKKSQDVCFVPDGDYTSYFQKILHPIPGPIFNQDHKQIGEHKGILFYTYGQRKGIGISDKDPYYVTKIDAKTNAIHVGKKEMVYKSQLIAADLNFIPFDRLQAPIEVRAKTRYIAPMSEATIEPLPENKAKVTFRKAQWAITPGQSIVFYQEDTVIGGGIIDQVIDSEK